MHPLEPMRRSKKWRGYLVDGRHICIGSKKELVTLENKRGVYFIMHLNRTMLYIGASNNLGKRIDVYRRVNIGEVNTYLYAILKFLKSKNTKSRFGSVSYHALVLYISGSELAELETYLIKKLKPICNRLVSYSWANRIEIQNLA